MTRCAPVSAGDPGPALAPPHTDWLRHVLIVTGPVADVTALREAAAGAGAIPWAYPDLDRWEEDQVHALVQPPDRIWRQPGGKQGRFVKTQPPEPEYMQVGPVKQGRLALANRDQHRDRVGHQAAEGEQERRRARPVKPLGVVH